MTCQVSVYSEIDNFWVFFQNEMNAGDFITFAIAGGWLETTLKCLSLQQNTGNLATMYDYICCLMANPFVYLLNGNKCHKQWQVSICVIFLCLGY